MAMILPEAVFQDVRYGARMLYRNRGFTAAAVLALGLGIGLNTAVFTAYKAMVARPLDTPYSGEMVNVALTRTSGATDYLFSYPDFAGYRDAAHSFSGLIAFSPEHMALSKAGGVLSQRKSASGSFIGRLGLLSAGAANTEFASVFAVSENYFHVLGVRAMRGRTFDQMGAHEIAASAPVLISENYWQRRFMGDAGILGKTIRLNGAPLTVAGITPQDFVGTGVAVPDFWLPLSLEPLVHADDEWLRRRDRPCCRLFGRLAAGTSVAQARAELALLTDRLRALHDPGSDAARPAMVLVWPGSPFPLPLRLLGGLQLAVLLIMAATGMVLAVSCANVASLQLARAGSRERELRTRLSLGAGRWRVVRQLLTESALLALLSGAVALVLTWALLRVAVALAAEALPVEYGTLVFNVTPDVGIFAFVFGISLVAGVLFGVAPALESSRRALSAGVRGSTSEAGSRRLQDFLVAAQVALSLALTIAGCMLIRSSLHALSAETGYDGKHVVDLDIQFPEAVKYSPASRAALMEELRTKLGALPGVAEITSARPPGDNIFRTPAVPVDGERSTGRALQSVLHYTYVEQNYFQTLGIPLLQGGGVQARGVVLSESAARQLWPGQNAVGHSLRLGAIDERMHGANELFAGGPAWQVVGVARDTRGVEFDGSDARQVYLPLGEEGRRDHPMLIRAADPSQVTRGIEAAIEAVNPNLITATTTLAEMMRTSPPFVVASFSAAIASTVGLLGLLLASMGIYGTVSYVVVMRTREVGIRVAVGAQKADILGLILRGSARPVIAGLAAGMFLATGVAYVLRGLLYGVYVVDGISFGGVSLLFLMVALGAAYPPARRAMRVDPVVALRYE